MDYFLNVASGIWARFTAGGADMIQNLVFRFSGYELSEFAALVILLGSSASFIVWLLLRLKRPRKAHYLMEGGHRYYRP